ncbi:MAG: YgiT-type zinc finger protein [Desulfobacteraceae bacterium]|nr:YgiT-type zinc finger protein [Desulfobacteraceae bacterium]
MNCPICNSEMVCKRTTHHYTESGLDNVFLDGVEVCQCSCSEKIVSIPAIPELHSKIGLDMIRKEALLNDREIRFLRKNMGLTKKNLLIILVWIITLFHNGKITLSQSASLMTG